MTIKLYIIRGCKKIDNYLKPKCPNCKNILSKTVWADNTVELYCDTCKYP